MTDLRDIARLLNGDVVHGQVLAPGPAHSPQDRSLSVKMSATAPDGFLVFSHSGDRWQDCRDHVAERLGLRREGDAAQVTRLKSPRSACCDGKDERAIAALNIWNLSTGPTGTPVEVYLASRGLDLGEDLAGEALRWTPRIRAMVALFRSIATGEPQAVSCTYLNAQAQKIERKFYGPVGGCAVMLDPFDSVTTGLFISEGIESGLAARQIGLRPAWALGSAGALGRFPVLAGIETLSILREHDAANEKAANACAERWLAAGREVRDVTPVHGKDINDAIKGAR